MCLNNQGTHCFAVAVVDITVHLVLIPSLKMALCVEIAPSSPYGLCFCILLQIS